MSPHKKPVVIIGAGMSGLGAAIRLLETGYQCVLLEAAPEAGGLAGRFKVKEKNFPLGYHHILSQDKPLIATLKKLGFYPRVAWKKGKVLFAIDGRMYDLQNPLEFVKFPMRFIDKLRFIKLIMYCMLKKNWNADLGDAQLWIDRIASPPVREVIFDPLIDIKYGLPANHVSANWLGSRLHYQEFSKPLGYIPGENWTRVLTEILVQKVKDLGGTIITNAAVQKVIFANNTFREVTYQHHEVSRILTGDILINTAPPHIFLALSGYRGRVLEKVEYLDALSVVLETKQKLPREFYLLSCLKPRYSFGGIFMLSALNETIGTGNNQVLNFFTTLSPAYEYLRNKSPEELLACYQKDFKKLFGFLLEPLWSHRTLITNYSPRFLKQYENVDHRGSVRGLYFAGNYMTYPIITSTGSAIESGEAAAKCIIEDYQKSL